MNDGPNVYKLCNAYTMFILLRQKEVEQQDSNDLRN